MHDIGKGVIVHSYPGLFPLLLEELQDKEWLSIADVVGQVLFPFPARAEYPLAGAVEEGSLSGVTQFLPEDFFDQPLVSADELVSLVKAVSSRVRLFVEETRKSIS